MESIVKNPIKSGIMAIFDQQTVIGSQIIENFVLCNNNIVNKVC